MILGECMKTIISKDFQTVIPLEIRKKFKLRPGNIMEWQSTKDSVEVKFRKKVTFEDISGIINGPETDAVELKKRVQRGEKI